jgi:uncharacterized protein YjcR
MPHSAHTPQERRRICRTVRQLQAEGHRFADLCERYSLRPATLRAWLLAETRAWSLPPVPNQGRIT